MLRKILIGFCLIVMLAFGGLAVFIQTFDLNRYLPQLTEQASKILGRKVTVERAGFNLSLARGIVADIAAISIAEDENFGKEPFLHIDHIHCGVSLMALLTKRQLAVTSIVIDSPKIRVVRSAQGDFNYEGIIEATKPDAAAKPQENKDAVAALPMLLVNSFEILNGNITVIDGAVNPPMQVAVQSVDAKVTNFSLTDPFKVQLAASVFSQGQNIHVDGTGRIDMGLQQFRWDDVHASFDFASLDLAGIEKNIPSVGDVGLKEGLKGSIEAVINQMVVSAKGLLVLSLEGKLTGGVIPIKMLPKPIDQMTAVFDINESKLKVSQFSLNLGTGKVSGSAVINDYMKTQGFDGNIAVEHLLLEDVVEQSKSPVRIKGSLSGTAKFAGHGFSPEGLNQMTGQAEFALADGELTNVNIIKDVLGQIPVIGQLLGVAGSEAAGGWQEKIDGSLTRIEKASVKARIEQGYVLIDDAQAANPEFSLSAHGRAGFDQTVDVDAELKMSQEFSASLTESKEDLKALLDEDQSIHFPLKIIGKIPDLKYVPDLAYISKLLLVNKGGGALQKVLDKNPDVKKYLDIFTGGGEGQAPEGGAASEGGQAADENSGAAQAQKLLKGLFK